MMPMDKSAWQIAVLFAGAALGVTYLGGYEWLRFFSYFGSWGTIGIALASLGLGWFGYSALAVCHRFGYRSLHDLLLHWFGESIAPTLSALIHFFLLAYVGAMLGQQASQIGSGTFAWMFLLSPVLLAIFFLIRGSRLILFGTAVLLAAGLLLFALVFLEQRHVPIPHLGYQMNVNWILHTGFYVATHFLLCLILTLPLAWRSPQLKAIRQGVLAGTSLFFLVAMLGHAILLAYWHDVHASQAPFRLVLLSLSGLGDWIQAIFTLFHGGILLAASVYALASPVSVRHDLAFWPLVIVMLAAVLLLSAVTLLLPWSFSLLASGATYCGLLLLIRFIWKRQT